MIHLAISVSAVTLTILMFFSLYRGYVGPEIADRNLAVNVVSTKVTVLIVLIASITGEASYIDVALVYAMIGFITTISISKYLEKGSLS